MKIAIDISPLQTGHKVRGTGFYLHYLKRSLEQHFPKNKYTFFNQGEKIPNEINIVHYPYFEPFFRTLPFIKKNKTIVTVHDLTPIIFPQHFPAGLRGNFSWQIQKYLLRQVDAIITDSENSKRDIARIVNYPKEKIHVAYLAAGEEFKKVHSSQFTVGSLRKKYNFPEKFALYVGDVTWNKNLPRLVKAAQQAKIPLVMVGKALINKDIDTSNPWNNDIVEVQQLIKKDTNIICPGFISTEELVLLYNTATVFIMPSLYEGFGLPILEAMSCGCPVITTKEGSLPEVAGEAAYYVDAYSVENISQGLQMIFRDTTLQKELSEKGLKQTRKFSWKKTAEQTISVYRKVYETKNN
ncbi:MAG TPA: glycosyltransferase family 1 protein [Candidatus Saccharimonadales bacterium]|nr:glycosyltransferase family 1 protein [Candidatus Saccharimonadales bacterium]